MVPKNEKPSEGGELPATGGQVVTPEQRKSLAERAEAGESLNVGELALVSGNVRRVNLPSITTVNSKTGATDTDHATSAFTPAHQAAASLHGWHSHSHHEGRPMEMTLADYKHALQAALETPSGFITPVPYAPAFSKHAPTVTLVTDKLERKKFTPAEATK